MNKFARRHIESINHELALQKGDLLNVFLHIINLESHGMKAKIRNCIYAKHSTKTRFSVKIKQNRKTGHELRRNKLHQTKSKI